STPERPSTSSSATRPAAATIPSDGCSPAISASTSRGKPAIVPKNQPGAGSFLAVNTIFNVSPKDGTVVGIGAPTIPLDEKLGTQGVRFKTAELNWIGRIDSLVNIVFLWKTSPVKTFADAQKLESTLSGTGVGSTVSIYPTVMNN